MQHTLNCVVSYRKGCKFTVNRSLLYLSVQVKDVAGIRVYEGAIPSKQNSSMTVKLGECMRSKLIRSKCGSGQWGNPFICRNNIINMALSK